MKQEEAQNVINENQHLIGRFFNQTDTHPAFFVTHFEIRLIKDDDYVVMVWSDVNGDIHARSWKGFIQAYLGQGK